MKTILYLTGKMISSIVDEFEISNSYDDNELDYDEAYHLQKIVEEISDYNKYHENLIKSLYLIFLKLQGEDIE